MGMDPYTTVAGLGMGLIGAAFGSGEADKKRQSVLNMMGQWLPDINQNTADYFKNATANLPGAENLNRSVGMADMGTGLAMQEQAMPGIGAARSGALAAAGPLAAGELPPSVMANFMRAGGARAAGAGHSGDLFSSLMTGLFSAQGSLGAMKEGSGLLATLLGTIPHVSTPGSASFLGEGVPGAMQRTSTQMGVRGQNIGIGEAAAGMPTGTDVWSKWLMSTGGMMTGNGMMGGFGGGGSGDKGVNTTAGDSYYTGSIGAW